MRLGRASLGLALVLACVATCVSGLLIVNPDPLGSFDDFGESLSVEWSDDDGRWLGVVGEHGRKSGVDGKVHVYKSSDGMKWTLVESLQETQGTDKIFFGFAVATDGTNIVASGLRANSGTGGAWVYVQDSTDPDKWSSQALVPKALPSNPLYGWSVDIYQDTAVVGDTRGSGAVHVFSENSGVWSETSVINGQGGLGGSLDLQAGLLAVGAPTGDSDAGAVFLYDQGSNWGLVTKLSASDAETSSAFGASIDFSPSGCFLLVGSPFIDAPGATSGGAAYLYGVDVGGPNAWGQVEKFVSPTASGFNHAGRGVGMYDDLAVVGIPESESDYNQAGPGRLETWRFNKDSDSWDFESVITEPATTDPRNMGLALAASSKSVVWAGSDESVSSFKVDHCGDGNVDPDTEECDDDSESCVKCMNQGVEDEDDSDDGGQDGGHGGGIKPKIEALLLVLAGTGGLAHCLRRRR